MSKYITTTFSSIGSRQPFTAPSLKFLQDGIKETNLNLAYSLVENAIGPFGGLSPTVPYVLYGVVTINLFGTVVISAGSILYNGEVYTTKLFTGTFTTGIFSAHITNYNDPTLDPTQFSDFSTHNIHNDRYIVWQQDTTGDFLYSACQYLQDVPTQIAAATASVYSSISSDLAALQPSAWTQISAMSGFSATGSLYTTPAYSSKDGLGSVSYYGGVTRTGLPIAVSAAPYFAQALTGCYPSSPRNMVATWRSIGGGYANAYIQIHSDGSMQIFNIDGVTTLNTGDWIQMDRLTYITL